MRGSPKKFSLTPMQKDILLEMEDCWECEFVTLINTVRPKESQEDHEKEQFKAALKGLIRLGFIELCKECLFPTRSLPRIEGPHEPLVDEYAANLIWDDDEQLYGWPTNEFLGASDVYVCLTKRGEDAVFR